MKLSQGLNPDRWYVFYSSVVTMIDRGRRKSLLCFSWGRPSPVPVARSSKVATALLVGSGRHCLLHRHGVDISIVSPASSWPFGDRARDFLD